MFERIKMAFSLFYQALTDPESVGAKRSVGRRNIGQLNEYQLAWAFYDRKMFTPEADWAWYRSPRGLYEHTRLIFNPVPTIVDFYVDNVWEFANDKERPHLVTPVSYSESDELTEAIAQTDRITNWWKAQKQVKAYTAATGACLVEITEDAERQVVTQNTVWRGFVTELKLNNAGDVTAYTLEYDAYDEDKKEWYRFKKQVDKEKIQYFRDDKPFVSAERIAEAKAAGLPAPEAVYYHELEFCPAVWFQQTADGSPAFSDFNKVNHANSLACHLHDNIHKEIESGKILGMEGNPEDIQVISGGSKNPDGSINETDSRLNRVLLAAKGAVSVNDLSGIVKLAEAHPYLKELLLSFGSDYPELEYRQILKESAQISGIALERLLTPAQNRLDRVVPEYNGQLVKLRQMQIAVAGERIKQRAWTNLNKQQQVFAPFNLDSYKRGELDFNVKRSMLIELSEDEREDLQAKKLSNALLKKEIGFDDLTIFEDLGIEQDKINVILRGIEERRAEQQQQFNAGVEA